MKIKIQFFPSNKFEVPFFVGIPASLKYFNELKDYIYKAFNLKQITLHSEQFEILLDDCRIPKFQKIAGFITQQDIFKLTLVPHFEYSILQRKVFEWKAQFNLGSNEMLDFEVLQEEQQSSSESVEQYEKFEEIFQNKIEDNIQSRVKIEQKWQWQDNESETGDDSSIEQIQKKIKLDQEDYEKELLIKSENNAKYYENYDSQILRPQSQIYQPVEQRPIASPSKHIASPSRQIVSPSRQIASPSRQIASPSRVSKYQEPIGSRIIAQPGCPSIYSPSKSKYLSQSIQQQLIPQSSYFIQNVPEMNPYVPDYATYLTQSPRGSQHIEQPANEPPTFVPQLPAQSSITPGEPVRFDHYSTVGDAPARIMPSGSPDRTIKARLLQQKSYQSQYY